MSRVELDGLFDVGDHVADVDRFFIQKHEKSFRVGRRLKGRLAQTGMRPGTRSPGWFAGLADVGAVGGGYPETDQ